MNTRPPLLFPLFAELTSLPGVGPKTAGALEQLSVRAPRDLLFTLPYAVIDRRPVARIRDAAVPGIVTVRATIGVHRPPQRKGGPYRIVVDDGDTSFDVVFFHARTDYLQRLLPTGQRRVLSGKAELFDGVIQMVHPDHVLTEVEGQNLQSFEPVYPLTSGVTQKTMTRAAAAAVELCPEMAEWIDPALKQKENWPGFQEALQKAHNPQGLDDIVPEASARRRLAYDELFAHQVTLALARQRRRTVPGRSAKGDGRLRSSVLAALPYKPTGAQVRAVAEIEEDMASPRRMNRLLQGDVGSGKTLVALLALLIAVEAGGQGVLMAPTEILARQHFEALSPLAAPFGVRIDILTGRDKGSVRREKLGALADGRIDILLGTHAVFQKDVNFQNLRLAIVDEQHRFGVRQRLELGQKGDAVDVLVMTATPIPRSLALAQYGDMDVSVLDEKPAGRKPIKTALVALDRLDEVVSHLSRAIAQGQQAYWVCPLVDESEVVDLAAAEARFARLRAALGNDVVGLVHGQMPGSDRDATMARFQANDIKVLVATTVIEVGVNVPNATIMVIERADHFGLSQLHQLRGRVGRGEAASTCLLLYQAPLGQGAERRLKTLRATEDGFQISQVDLEMRGAGDVMGTAQSGLPRFQIADLERQSNLMQVAQSDARALLTQDSELMSPRGIATRNLLWVMRRDEAFQLMKVG